MPFRCLLKNGILPQRSTCMLQSDHGPSGNYVLSNKNDKVNNWSQEMHDITPHTEFGYIKGKNNLLADSLSGLRHLGLQDDNDPERPGQEYGKTIFETDENIIHSLDDDQKTPAEFEINGQHILDKITLITHMLAVQILILYNTHSFRPAESETTTATRWKYYKINC